MIGGDIDLKITIITNDHGKRVAVVKWGDQILGKDHLADDSEISEIISKSKAMSDAAWGLYGQLELMRITAQSGGKKQ